MSASVAVTSSPQPPTTPALSAGRRRPRLELALVWPTLFTLANAIAFVLARPDVNDLAAARARASAAANDVGLTYWFDWFGGGSTPGNYSVITPSMSALIGTELLGGIAAVAAAALGTIALRRTSRPVAGAVVVALGATINLWSGRIPFLLGSAIGLGAVIALLNHKRVATVVLTIVSVLASPVSGALIAMGASGTFLTTRTRSWRPMIAWAVGTVAVSLVTVAVIFGAPGPQPFSTPLALEVVGGLVLLWFALPPDHIRTTVVMSFLGVLVLYAVPNGMGSNVTRLVWFVLPAMVIATSRRRRWVAALLVAPVVLAGAAGTATDLRNAVRPVSSVAYYQPLADRLDKIDDLANYRVEVVNHGAHAAYDALLDHAMLARGWETQEDTALNESLREDPLSPITYKVWLDNNAVGYVALPAASVGTYPEYDLVKSEKTPYLSLIWETTDWRLYAVSDPTPIVAAPAKIIGHTQAKLTVQVPCACELPVRVRWSKFLEGTRQQTADSSGNPPPTVSAQIVDDGSGWTTMTTPRPGTYVLHGSITGLLR